MNKSDRQRIEDFENEMLLHWVGSISLYLSGSNNIDIEAVSHSETVHLSVPAIDITHCKQGISPRAIAYQTCAKLDIMINDIIGEY